MAKKETDETRQISELLQGSFPEARIDVYRHNSASIRVRIIDESFRGRDRVSREEQVLPILRQLPEETYCDITILLLLTDDERSRSMMNMEFEDPVPSSL